MDNIEHLNHTECHNMIRPVRDALEVLKGKWKLPIIIALSFGKKRYTQIAKEIDDITDKMLAKELKDLELNGLIERIVHETEPQVVEYSLTAHSQTLNPVIESLRTWGIDHRNFIVTQCKENNSQ